MCYVPDGTKNFSCISLFILTKPYEMGEILIIPHSSE